LLRQEPLAVALPDPDDVPLEEEGGTTQEDWQLAAWELQPIMQFVVVELCASRIDLLAASADALTDIPIANAVTRILKPRTSASFAARMRGTITQSSLRRNALIGALALRLLRT
jgi:hypothetical protein